MQLAALERTADDLRRALDGFDPARVAGTDALALLEAFTTIEKLAAGGRLLVAPRVEATNVWKRGGHRSAAAHLAQATGTGLGTAIDTLDAGRRLGSMPTTDAAVREGRLSESQVKEIAGADAVRPGAEAELVEVAEQQSLSVLKLRCRRVKAEAAGQGGAYRALHRARSFRSWTDAGGAVRFDARLTPDQGARLLAAVKTEADRRSRQAQRAGSPEPRRAFEADAIVALACRGGASPSPGPADPPGHRDTPVAGPGAVVTVRVDHDALLRGHVETGEVCEIPGIGPIPVEVARQLAVDSFLSVLVTRGVDVTAIAHAGRTIPSALRRALTDRDPECVVPGARHGRTWRSTTSSPSPRGVGHHWRTSPASARGTTTSRLTVGSSWGGPATGGRSPRRRDPIRREPPDQPSLSPGRVAGPAGATFPVHCLDLGV